MILKSLDRVYWSGPRQRGLKKYFRILVWIRFSKKGKKKNKKLSISSSHHLAQGKFCGEGVSCHRSLSYIKISKKYKLFKLRISSKVIRRIISWNILENGAAYSVS